MPIVVLPSLGNTRVKDLQQAVLQHLGTAYIPDEVVTLTELGLADFPKTTSGKVQKSRLAELVRLFRVRRDHKQNSSMRSIHDTVLHTYYKSTGLAVEDLDLLTPVTNFADSISFMRVRDALRKELGYTLTFKEMTEYPNIQSQIRLLQGRDIKSLNGAFSTSKLSGPPSLDEMTITFGSSDEAERMKTVISKTIEAKGFNWSQDVASIIPAHDFMQILLESELISTWNFAIAILADGSSTQVGQDVRSWQSLSDNLPAIAYCSREGSEQ